jgi:uncharacterized protein
MIVLLSPSKTLDFKSTSNIIPGDDPLFIKDSKKLISILKKKRIPELMSLMDISYKLAETNFVRYQEWTYPYIPGKARPALAAFKGDVYEGLRAWELNSSQIELADKTVRILSGLYGLLKPTDLILPYRLEMGINLEGKTFKNLYEFWSYKITKRLADELKSLKEKYIVNLASAEYSKSINFKKIGLKVIEPFFLEFKNGEYKFISFDGKKARGTMTRFIIDNNISDVEQIKLFNYDSYSFNENMSKNSRWVFVR